MSSRLSGPWIGYEMAFHSLRLLRRPPKATILGDAYSPRWRQCLCCSFSRTCFRKPHVSVVTPILLYLRFLSTIPAPCCSSKRQRILRPSSAAEHEVASCIEPPPGTLRCRTRAGTRAIYECLDRYCAGLPRSRFDPRLAHWYSKFDSNQAPNSYTIYGSSSVGFPDPTSLDG